MGRDPIEEQGGLHLYGFCRNDGVNNWDFLGQEITPEYAASALARAPNAVFFFGNGDEFTYVTENAQFDGGDGFDLRMSRAELQAIANRPRPAPNSGGIGNAITIYIATVGGQTLDNVLNVLAPAAVEAQRGALGFSNSLTFGLSGTGGVDPNAPAFQTGRTVGAVTKVAVAAAVVGGLVGAGTPAFYSGMSSSTAASLAAANGGYTVGTTLTGSFVANTIQPLVLNTLGANVGETVMTGVWSVTSGAYAVVSAATSPTALYFGTGAGTIWTRIEQPILNLMGTGVVMPPGG